MLHKEFEELSGIKVDAATFKKIHEMYMMAGDHIDKAEFCQAYKTICTHSSVLNVMQGLYKTAKNAEADREEAYGLLREEQKQSWEFSRKMGIFLLEEAHEMGSDMARTKAIDILGRKGYIKETIERGHQLWDKDKKMLIELLNKQE